MKKIIVAWLGCLALILSVARPRKRRSRRDVIVGVWHTTGKRGDVRIFKRGDQYFGQVLSMADPYWPPNDKYGMGGKPKTDRAIIPIPSCGIARSSAWN